MKSAPQKLIFHLLPNAHLDPVWLWDWREGLNEGLITARTILDLMDEFEDLTFIRGESSIYQHIERTDPATFRRIARLVENGRWDVVGGTYNQPDTNLAAAETLCRQFETGQAYFQSRFGTIPRIAWQADSFGHTPGLPNILRAFGMEGFMFTRPNRRDFPLDQPAFWWQTDHGENVLAYRQYFIAYCCERFNLPAVLDETLQGALVGPHRHVAVLMGLGNHGGGPSRRHLLDTRTWAKKHPEVEVRFSTFHRFFDALQEEILTKREPIPTVRGDLGFCLRGCYSSLAKFKFAYRRAETLLTTAEATQSIVRSVAPFTAAPLADAWEGILFNSFHDILPGSSIERAFDEQLAWVGKSHHEALSARFEALNQLAAKIDTRVPRPKKFDTPAEAPVLVWNPLPRPVKAWVELEAALDYRPDFKIPAKVGSLPLHLHGPAGEKPHFQEIPTEHHAMRNGVWRKRVLFQTDLPAMGWKIFRLGRAEKTPAAPVANDTCAAGKGARAWIGNALWKVRLDGSGRVKLSRLGKPILDAGRSLRIETFRDIWGSWGGMSDAENLSPLNEILESWTITESTVLQQGPEQAVLWTRWKGERSWIDLTFAVRRGEDLVRVDARMLWNERCARVKLILPSRGTLQMETPGSVAERPQPGQLPCGRWLRRVSDDRGIGFVSDVLSDVNTTPDETRITIARASRYADDVPTRPEEDPWRPATDCGELKFQFLLTPPDADLPRLTEEFLTPPVTLCVPPHPGELPAKGSLAEIKPAHVTLLSLQADNTGRLRLRVQNRSEKPTSATLRLGSKTETIGRLGPYEIATFAAAEIRTS